jgi:ABC-2 type transport system ATP-binding protein
MEALRLQRLVVQARQMAAAQSALENAGYSVTVENGGLFIADARAIEAPDEVAALLVRAGTPPTKLVVEQEDLETHFMRLTGENS